MLQEKVGDIFSHTDELVNGIFMHGCNAQGVMGAGVAALVRDKFPEAYNSYVKYCYDHSANNFNPLGHVNFVLYPLQNLVIANAITQFLPGPHALIEAIQQALTTVVEYAQWENLEVHSVKIGCGIGGLEWDDVKSVYEYVSDSYPEVDITVWSLD
jgi:O-acetyl-ADP-ribose deacetylase (regulator of RNase III)